MMITASITDCAGDNVLNWGGPPNPPFNYLEAWHVSAGQTSAENPVAGWAANDFWWYSQPPDPGIGQGPNTIGNISFQGTAAFYEGMVNLPASFMIINGPPENGLEGTNDTSSVHGNTLGYRPLIRSMIVSWDCCCGNENAPTNIYYH
jgi:hypothetical protein